MYQNNSKNNLLMGLGGVALVAAVVALVLVLSNNCDCGKDGYNVKETDTDDERKTKGKGCDKHSECESNNCVHLYPPRGKKHRPPPGRGGASRSGRGICK